MNTIFSYSFPPSLPPSFIVLHLQSKLKEQKFRFHPKFRGGVVFLTTLQCNTEQNCIFQHPFLIAQIIISKHKSQKNYT